MPALEQMKQMLLPLRLYILSPESRVYAELCAYAQGLEAAQQRLDQLMEAAFIQTAPADRLARSEERRVGKECRSRWSPYH